MRSRPALLALVAGAVAVAAAPAPAARTPVRTVAVHDNYYLPGKLTVKAGTIVRWRWSQDTADVHDVKLRKGPKGARRFQSEPLAAGQSFKRKLVKPGTYSIICTFHEEEMRMTIRVKRR